MLAKFFSYYRPHMALFWLDFGCAITLGLLELAFPLAISGFIDKLLPRGDWGLTLLAAAGLLAIYAVNTGLMAVVIYFGHKLGINIETEMRRRAFAHLTRLSWGWFDRNETGQLTARVTRDLEEIGEVAHHGPEDAIIAVMTFIGAFILMFYLHPQLALIALAIVPAMVWLLVIYGGRMTRAWQAIYGRVGAFNTRLNESLGGIRLVQAFTNEPHEERLFARDNHSYRSTKLDAYRIMGGLSAIHYMGLRLVQVVIMVAGAYYVFEGTLSTGAYVGFLLLVGVFFRPLEKIAAVVETYPRGIAGFRRRHPERHRPAGSAGTAHPSSPRPCAGQPGLQGRAHRRPGRHHAAAARAGRRHGGKPLSLPCADGRWCRSRCRHRHTAGGR